MVRYINDNNRLLAIITAAAALGVPPEPERRPRLEPITEQLPKRDKRRPDGLTREQARNLKRMGKLPKEQ